MLMATAVVILPAVPIPNIICLIYIPAIGSEYVAIPIFAILSRAAAKRTIGLSMFELPVKGGVKLSHVGGSIVGSHELVNVRSSHKIGHKICTVCNGLLSFCQLMMRW